MPRDIVSPYIGPERDPNTGRQMRQRHTGRKRAKRRVRVRGRRL